MADDLAVHQWLDDNNDNLRELDLYQNILENSENLGDFKQFDVDAEWNAFSSANINIEEDVIDAAPLKTEAKVIQLPSSAKAEANQKKAASINANQEVTKPVIKNTIPKRKNLLAPISVAASLLLLLGSYFMFFNGEEIEAPLVYKVVTTTDTPQSVTLEDGTVIELHANSELTYPESFSGLEERDIQLVGSGKFKVVKNPTLPLIVGAGETEVKVLGTTFVIDMVDQESVEVENIEGLIKFYEAGNEENGHLLTEGQKMIHSEGGFTDTTEEEEPLVPMKGHTISYILNHLELISDGRSTLVLILSTINLNVLKLISSKI